MCAHIGQKRHIYPPSIFRLHFWLVPPPPIPQVHRGGCYRENFFLILFFSFLPFYFYSYFIFLFFSDFRLDSCFDSVFQIILFNYFDSIKIRHLILDFIFRTPYRLNSHTSFRSIFTRLRFSYSLLIFDSFLLASISTCFSIADSTLWLFNSLSLLLVINKHLCLYEFGLCLFWLF